MLGNIDVVIHIVGHGIARQAFAGLSMWMRTPGSLYWFRCLGTCYSVYTPTRSLGLMGVLVAKEV